MKIKSRIMLALAIIVVVASIISSTFASFPSSIATTSTNYGQMIQRKGYVASGLVWSWYVSSTVLGYKTTTDGSSWSEFNSIQSGLEDRCDIFSVCYDGNYVYYALGSFGTNKILYYRKGTPNSNGTITWLADVQTILSATASISYRYPTICADSSGYPIVGYTWYNSTSSKDIPYVVMSDYNNGTWHTKSGFPYQLTTATISGTNSKTLVVPLLNDAWYVIYPYIIETKYEKGRLYNSTMGEEQDFSLDGYHPNDPHQTNALAYGNTVFFCLVTGDYSTRMRIRSPAGSWTAEIIDGNTTNDHGVSMSVASNGNIVIFWDYNPTAGHWYYRIRYVNGTYGSTVDWFTFSTDYKQYMNSFYLTTDFKSYIQWVDSSFLIYINQLDLTPTVTVTVTYPVNTTYTTSTIPVNFSASGGTIDKKWYNCKHNGSWLFSNTTYTTPTTMTISNNGAYTFYAWANNTESVKGNGTVTFFYGSCILTVITKDAEDNQLLNGVSVSINTLDMLLSFGSGKTINGLVNFHLPFNQSFLICASKPFYHRVNDTVFMDADKNDTLVLSLGVNENEGGIFLTDVPTDLADRLGIPVIAGQILVCLILAALFLFPIFIVSKGDIVIITVSSVVLLGFFTGVGWINYFVFLVLGGIIAAMWANKIAKWISGG